jgi:hypothetical protein
MTNNATNLNEQWRDFLRQNLDARLIVDGIMDRMGFEEDEVLMYLLNAWANTVAEPQREFDTAIRSPSTRH